MQIFIGTMGMTGAALSGPFVKAFRDSIRQKLFGAMDALELLSEVNREKGMQMVEHSARHKSFNPRLLLAS